MIDIINTKQYKIDDDAYFIMSSIDKPHLYIKCYGIIKSRVVKEDNVIYGLKLKKVFISNEKAKHRIHRRIFRTRKNDTKFGVSKKIYCLDYLSDDSDVSLNIGLSNLMRHYQFMIPSIFLCEDLYTLNDLYDKAEGIIKEKIRITLLEVENN